MHRSLLLVALLVFVPTVAHADPVQSFGFGARVGGYAFRRPSSEGVGTWDDCRMGGLGVFVQHGFTPNIFAEAGIDTYFSALSPTPNVSSMDRFSGLGTVAIGARAFPTFVISPYAQIGIGAELTRVTVPNAEGTNYLLAMAFLGVGVDLNLGSHVRLGAAMRVNGMGQFEPTANGQSDPRPGLAGQALFYLRYDL